MLVQIKNAQMVAKPSVVLPYSNLKYEIAKLLVSHNFIGGVEKKKRKLKKSEVSELHLDLKYSQSGPAVSQVKMISKPSRRVYASASELHPVRNGYGIAIVSTTKGLMTSQQARKAGLGGEVICEIW